jgi:hypothetical protein
MFQLGTPQRGDAGGGGAAAPGTPRHPDDLSGMPTETIVSTLLCNPFPDLRVLVMHEFTRGGLG